MSNLTQSNQKTNLEKFHQGFYSFVSMNACDNFIVFKCANPSLVASCAKDAEQRINDLQLPLTVVPSKFPFNTFIVREVAA